MGTETIAVTYIQMVGKSASQKILLVNHPFLTTIVDNDTGAVLFAGVVNDPSAS